MARLTFTVPLRVFHRSMAVTKSAGRCLRSIWRRKAIFGWVVVTTVCAEISSPPSRTTPVARPP